MAEPSLRRWGHDVLCVFDVWKDTQDFLIDVVQASKQSSEGEELLRQSLLAGAKDWNYLIECAKSIRRNHDINCAGLDGQDVLAYIWYIFEGIDLSPNSKPWEETDRLIAQAKNLEQDPEIRPSSLAVDLDTTVSNSSQSIDRGKGHVATSHYWSDQPETQDVTQSYKMTNEQFYERLLLRNPQHQDGHAFTVSSNYVTHASIPTELPDAPSWITAATLRDQQLNDLVNLSYSQESVVSVKQTTTSPYFTSPASERKNKVPKKRPPAGTVSTVPFAPLNSPFFGVIQEDFAHDPFWLLIAVTFLIKTNGKLAIPMFYKVKERFPTPRHVADPENTETLIGMIKHLGLSVVRVAFMQKYARGFLENPPRASARYRVKNYDRRDIDPSLRSTGDDIVDSETPTTPGSDQDELEAWEIGHLTKGKYAIDSWRIFCRDELLGRALDWNGKGREPEFQPEWMRVMPEDKELRAYLRWMWMREGWEWNPITGERTVLRDELRRAVNEGRVEYDGTGGLRILDEPQA